MLPPPPFRLPRTATMLVLIVASSIGVSSVHSLAQTMYKYVDENGKVTYSDRKPKPGEKAEIVKNDQTANIITLPKPKGTAAERDAVRTARVTRDAKERTTLEAGVATAEARHGAALKALEDGREPLPSELQIVVRQGGNSIIRKPQYFERIEALEAAVTQSSQALSKAREALRRGVD
jgi:Domain of unknown function (DUF4124)